MNQVKLYNTLTRTKELFQPLEAGKIRFYYCGPTVYWTQHLGNMRGMTMADLIVRVLKFNDYQVKLVRNYTDVGHLTSDEDEGEDKMEKASQRENLDPQTIAAKYIQVYEHDTKALNILDPDCKPRASQEISKIIKLVKTLVDQGFAYATDLAIYFNVSTAKDYTRLSRQNLEKNIAQAGSGDIQDKNKKNPQDFALWFFKAGVHKNALQTWPSPFQSPLVTNGQGFPGWHIECSVMSQAYLGDTLDIHMGGVEHIPVHHTNEIAQSEAATGKKFVNYWLHNEHLMVNNGKMSKSAGTAYSLTEVIEKGFDPLALRYFFLQAHYRSKQNFTWAALTAAQSALNKLYLTVLEYEKSDKINNDYAAKFLACINDDFNIPQGLALTWEMFKADIPPAEKMATVLKFDLVLGLNIETRILEIKEKLQNLPPNISELILKRDQARDHKDYQQADALRKKIEKSGYWLEDTSHGTRVIPKLN